MAAAGMRKPTPTLTLLFMLETRVNRKKNLEIIDGKLPRKGLKCKDLYFYQTIKYLL